MDNQLCFFDGFSLKTDNLQTILFFQENYDELGFGKNIVVNNKLTYDSITECFLKISLVKVFDEITHISIIGSFHKCCFEGQNHQDLKMIDFRNKVFEITKKFQINPSATQVMKLEYGANLGILDTWGYTARGIINNTVFLTKKTKTGKIENDLHKNQGASLIVDRKEFTDKFYFKSAQSGEEYEKLNIIRFERAYKARRPLKKIGIFTLEDLLTKDYSEKLNNFLIKAFSKLLIFQEEVLANTEILLEDKIFYLEHNSKNIWEKISRDPKEFYKKSKRFIAITDKYSKYNYTKELKSMLTEKLYN
ncbi:hypothetical protein ACQ33O_03915 [Ferruginibacter sp. SUN002]|uniref:hypothetical protein n=1 Tax=Ferruginibacter sp. SUN002 TaxID=2937789 RepID=UPI003D35FD1C